MSKRNTTEILNYFKNVLQTDFYLPYFFNETFLITSYEEKHNEPFLLYGLKNNEARNNFEEIVVDLIVDKTLNYEKEIDSYSVFNLYYSPFLIEYSFLTNKDVENTLLISPLFIELEVKDLKNPFAVVEDIINFFKEEENEENFTKNIFNSKDIILNPAMLVEPFELMDSSYYERINAIRKNKSKDFSINSFKELLEFIIDYIKELNYKKDILKNIEGKDYRFLLKELRKIFDVELNEFLTKQGLVKNIQVRDDGFIFIRNNTINHKDEVIINGLMNMYRQVEQNGLSEDNLLNIILKGNNYKYSASNFEQISKDDTTQIMTPFENNRLIRNHLGALSSEFDLTPSQKYCLNITNSHLPIIPINGSPGTGKTSLLRAIVGDITVKNALEYAKQLQNKNDSFNFKTPIVSFSTNNRALDNIIEGIISAFDEIKNSLESNRKTLADRWINPMYEFVYFDNNNKEKDKRKYVKGKINDIRLYIPKIKNNQEYINTNPQYPIFGSTIQNFSSLIEIIKSDIEYYSLEYLKEFHNVFGNPSNKFDESFAKNRLKLNLKDAIKTLNLEIEKNADILKKKNDLLDEWLNNKIDFRKESKELINILGIDYEKDISTRAEYNSFIEMISSNIDKIQFFLDGYEEEKNKFSKEYLLKIESTNKEIRDKEGIFDEEVEAKTEALINNLEIIIDDKRKNENLFKRICESIVKYFNKNSISIDKNNKQNIITQIQKELKEERLIENEQDFINLEKKRKKIESDFLEQLNKLEEEIINKLKIFYIEIISIESFKEDIKKAKGIINYLERIDKFFYDEYENKIGEIYKGIDSKIRTMSFLYAQHLQEALLLYELLHISENKNYSTKCFNCKCHDLTNKVNSEKNTHTFKCSNCGFIFTNYDKIFFQQRRLFNYELVELFEKGYFNNSGKCYTLKESENSKFWKITSIGKAKKDKSFNYLSVFFPIVNTTCHSFGSTMPLEEKGIDYLFIDEAGMVLIPYLINIYTGKKIFIFGDEKQIEPVYPLNIPMKARKASSKTIETDNENPSESKTKQEDINSYLIRRHISNETTKVKVYEFQSVLNSSVMSLANRSVYIKNDYVVNKEIGDVWLTEHFRCRKDIIDFCNEHIYHNMIKPMKDNKEGVSHLSIIDHDFNQKTHSNGSKYNEEEAKLIIEHIIHRMKDLNEEEKEKFIKSVGIISPYKEQAEVISRIAKQYKLNNLISGTVHKFQGSERDVIYISTTIGEKDNVSKAFFNNVEKPHIINVAVSRAKEELILVGNKVKLSENPKSLTSKLIKHIENVSQ